jgi:transcriptional regulator with XRE-family HTH domain
MKMYLKNLKYLLKYHNLTHDDIAKGLKQTQGSISHYLNERRIPTLTALEDIALYFRISPKDFIYTDLQASFYENTKEGASIKYQLFKGETEKYLQDISNRITYLINRIQSEEFINA